MAAPASKPSEEELRLQHAVYYNNNTSSIKDDVVQLASCWKTSHGPLTKQEAGLLLWYHCYRGEDGRTEIAGAGVINTCIATLDSQEATPAEKSIAAGMLLTLCTADPKHKEAAVRAKAGPNTCCQVLHGCLSKPEAVTRHVMPLLASLAASPPSLSMMLKALQGAVPWSTYSRMLEVSNKDHATTIAAADLIRLLATGREPLAVEAASAGLLSVLVASAARHKSAAAVAAAASCMQCLCEAAPDNRNRLGQVAGAVQQLVDLLGPPLAAVISWEQETYKHLLLAPATPSSPTAASAAVAASEQQQQQHQQHHSHVGWQQARPAAAVSSSSRASSSQFKNDAGGDGVVSLTGSRRPGALQKSDSSAEAGSTARRDPSIKLAKSIRLADRGIGDSSPGGDKPDLTLLSKSSIRRHQSSITGGTADRIQSGATGAARHARIREPKAKPPADAKPEPLPQPSQPLLCKNSTALKWDAPVPDATRAAVAGVLAELVLLPALCQAISARLAVPRLAAAIVKVVQELQAGAGKKATKKPSRLVFTPEAEALLCNACVCLKFLVAANNMNAYRVAACGCLPVLVQLGEESKRTHLRRSAQAIVSQVCCLSEVQDLVKGAQVPDELLVQAPMKLTDAETRQLAIEFPTRTLQPLEELIAKTRM